MNSEIDRLIAEKIFSWSMFRMVASGGGIQILEGIEPDGHASHVPSFSSDIMAAWEVVEKLKPLNIRLEQRGTEGTNWMCRLYLQNGKIGYADAKTASMAISLAALKAYGTQVPR